MGATPEGDDDVVEQILDELACRACRLDRKAWLRSFPRSPREIAELRGHAQQSQRNPPARTTPPSPERQALIDEARRRQQERWSEPTADWWKRLP